MVTMKYLKIKFALKEKNYLHLKQLTYKKRKERYFKTKEMLYDMEVSPLVPEKNTLK